jgi:RNA-directed DNA polymerase
MRFDMWMTRTFPAIPFERYADDCICHCRSAEEARALWEAVEARFAACRLVLHPQKTKLVYCKDTNRRGDFPIQSFNFLGYTFRPRKAIWRGGQYGVSFLPAASPDALKAIRQTIRRWELHHRSNMALDDLARKYNPYIRGWINYYSHFYKSALVPRVIHIAGYSLFSLTRASAVVKCQSALACFLLRLSSQAATSSVRICLSEIRRSRHWLDKTLSSDSAMSSQLPCLGV